MLISLFSICVYADDLNTTEESEENVFGSVGKASYSGLSIDWDKLVPGKDYSENDVIVSFDENLEDQAVVYEVAASCGCEVDKIIMWNDWKGGKVAHLIITDGSSVRDMIARLEACDVVSFAEVNAIYTFDDTAIGEEPERPTKEYSGLSIDWDKLVPGKDYSENDVIVSFAEDLEDQAVVYEVAATCGCEVDKIIMWNDWKGGKVAHLIITDGSSVRDMIARLEACDVVSFAEVNAIYTFDDTATGEEPERPAKEYSGWKRLYGNTRYTTMQKVVQEGWDNGSCETVIVATGQAFPDALSAAALAGIYNCPVVLSTVSYLDQTTRDEIIRLGAQHVIIIGSTSAVSEATENAI